MDFFVIASLVCLLTIGLLCLVYVRAKREGGIIRDGDGQVIPGPGKMHFSPLIGHMSLLSSARKLHNASPTITEVPYETELWINLTLSG